MSELRISGVYERGVVVPFFRPSPVEVEKEVALWFRKKKTLVRNSWESLSVKLLALAGKVDIEKETSFGRNPRAYVRKIRTEDRNPWLAK